MFDNGKPAVRHDSGWRLVTRIIDKSAVYVGWDMTVQGKGEVFCRMSRQNDPVTGIRAANHEPRAEVFPVKPNSKDEKFSFAQIEWSLTAPCRRTLAPYGLVVRAPYDLRALYDLVCGRHDPYDLALGPYILLRVPCDLAWTPYNHFSMLRPCLDNL
ncbi:hypothetical protein E2C01_045033 [Portunus trituberculatus]|uniref:Uncharacterized protein n=1 Tax=Portunus trituberculatus TaxID=210409 RepID=A0A5B7FX62_PORTR|nr:hypothetical protein [Portunus trituberculatus]